MGASGPNEGRISPLLFRSKDRSLPAGEPARQKRRRSKGVVDGLGASLRPSIDGVSGATAAAGRPRLPPPPGSVRIPPGGSHHMRLIKIALGNVNPTVGA